MKRMAFAVLLAVLAVPAFAQDGPAPYPVQRMDFDLWCTEQQHLPWERCDKRLPEDMQKFEAYRAIVERYEIPYLQDKENALRFDEHILRNDPVDKRPDSTVVKAPQPTDGP
jgi:hypothetical protein